MARHRSGTPASGNDAAVRPDGTPVTGPRPPRTGSWPAALDAAAQGPRRTGGRHRHDPATTPLDLAAIARAAAAARAAEPRPTPPGHDGPRAAPPRPAPPRPTTTHPEAPTVAVRAVPPTRTAPPIPAEPARPATGPVPATPARAGHRAPRRVARGLTPTRAAGALALFGALAGASVAAASTGPSFLAEPVSDTGELARPDPSVAPAGVASTAAHPDSSTPHTATPTTTTTAPTTTTTAPPDDGGKTLWAADFAGAGLDNFKSTPWNNEGAKSPVLSGGQLNFSMPGGGKRTEVEPDFKNLTEGDEYYFGFSVKLAPDFPTTTSDWQVITQFKNQGTGTPPLELKVQDGKFVLDGDGGAFSQVVGDARPGQWTDIALKVRFSSKNGTVSAWQDGVQKVTDYAPPSGTLYSGSSSYLKLGIYRDPSIDTPGKLSFGSYAIGTSLGSVGRGAHTTGQD